MFASVNTDVTTKIWVKLVNDSVVMFGTSWKP